MLHENAAASARALQRLALVLADEGGDLGQDLAAPFLAVEDAEMADLLLQQVAALRRRQAGAQAVRGKGLADAGDVVELALDRHQRRLADRARINRAAARGHGAER